ncbi:hypothetical protein BDZ45DRAFT_226729 [Acephala macrosclerotiorum]|nr:hypothetical protein BDZ45DRAFT_226729 [Acephala macrosclerotiorum]
MLMLGCRRGYQYITHHQLPSDPAPPFEEMVSIWLVCELSNYVAHTTFIQHSHSHIAPSRQSLAESPTSLKLSSLGTLRSSPTCHCCLSKFSVDVPNTLRTCPHDHSDVDIKSLPDSSPMIPPDYFTNNVVAICIVDCKDIIAITITNAVTLFDVRSL